MFEVISSISKYIFVTIIYLFMYSIIRLIYLDVKSMNAKRDNTGGNYPYLKLLNRREELNFKIEESYILDKDITVGRLDTNSIIIKDLFVSSNHAKIFRKDGLCFLEDLQSKNGTYLNDARVKSRGIVSLSAGDKIRMGSIEFLFITN